MATITDGLKDIFLAGVGALAITGEKAKELVDVLVEKGELTVEEGKKVTADLADKAGEAGKNIQYGALEARMSVMSKEEREAFAAKAAEIAARPDDSLKEKGEAALEDAKEAAGDAAKGAKSAAATALAGAMKVASSAQNAVEGAVEEAKEVVDEAKEKLANQDTEKQKTSKKTVAEKPKKKSK